MSTFIDTLDQNKVAKILEDLTERRPYLVDEASGDLRFALYLYMVDAVMIRRIGLSHNDLADYLWRDTYDNGTTPQEAVQECLENDDTYAAWTAGQGIDDE